MIRKCAVAALILFFLFGCHKDPTIINPPTGLTTPPPANGTAITVTIDNSKPQYIIPSNFAGLSYETKILAESPEILNENNKVLIQLIRNLGGGILRIGGDTSDETFWTGGARTSATGADSLTTTDVDRLAAFSKAIGWPVMFGLNLGYYNTAAAVNEAQYVYSQLQNNVYALQAGNEPDVYHLYALRTPLYSIKDYLGEFEKYKSAIQTVIPNVSFAGPGNAYNTDFISGFAEAENRNVSLLDAHYYVAGPATDPGITYKYLLNNDWKLSYTLGIISNEAKKFNKPFRITECNSIYGGGKAGVSDVFASALWALDFMWTVAGNGGQGINFHGGNGLIYSPVTIEKGVITARPEYYAMMAFEYGSGGVTTGITKLNKTEYNTTAYTGLKADGKQTVTLINKDVTDLAFTIQTNGVVQTIEVARLKAASITALTGTTFADSNVAADGTFSPKPTEYYVNKKSFIVNVPASSAVVVLIK